MMLETNKSERGNFPAPYFSPAKEQFLPEEKQAKNTAPSACTNRSQQRRNPPNAACWQQKIRAMMFWDLLGICLNGD
jgi:hypothetical protein